MNTPPVAFHDLAEESFPFTVEWFTEGTDEVVHTITVDGPGALNVPPITRTYGPCDMRITFADGETLERAANWQPATDPLA